MNAKSCLPGKLGLCWQKCFVSVGDCVYSFRHTMILSLSFTRFLKKKHQHSFSKASRPETTLYVYSFLKSECCGKQRLNTSEVSPCGEASSRWWSEPCALCVNAVVVWIVIAGLCVNLAQCTVRRDGNSMPSLPQHSCQFPSDQNSTYIVHPLPPIALGALSVSVCTVHVRQRKMKGCR